MAFDHSPEDGPGREEWQKRHNQDVMRSIAGAAVEGVKLNARLNDQCLFCALMNSINGALGAALATQDDIEKVKMMRAFLHTMIDMQVDRKLEKMKSSGS